MCSPAVSTYFTWRLLDDSTGVTIFQSVCLYSQMSFAKRANQIGLWNSWLVPVLTACQNWITFLPHGGQRNVEMISKLWNELSEISDSTLLRQIASNTSAPEHRELSGSLNVIRGENFVFFLCNSMISTVVWEHVWWISSRCTHIFIPAPLVNVVSSLSPCLSLLYGNIYDEKQANVPVLLSQLFWWMVSW